MLSNSIKDVFDVFVYPVTTPLIFSFYINE